MAERRGDYQLMSGNYGQSVLDQTTTLKGTWEYNGQEFDLEVKDISGSDWQLIHEYQDIAQGVMSLEDEEDIPEGRIEDINEKAENLDNFSWESGDGSEPFVQSVLDEKLVNPSPDVENTGMSKLRALFEGVMLAWQESDEVADAKEEMPLKSGNR